MAYNGFPATYQPIYYQPQYQAQQFQQPQQQTPQTNGIIWVSGEAGAKAYLVAPNTTVQLWDSESQRIYLKSADASGMPNIKVLEYTICGQTAQNASVSAAPAPAVDLSGYVTKGEFEALRAKIDALTAKGGAENG